MNFYKHHIGDYAQATAHLTFVEDAAYSRLLRKYYAEEKPIPADLKAAQRLVGARTREEREAVETVLAEYFVLEADGWHNKRADEELARANAQAETNRRIAEEREARRRARQAESAGTNRPTAGNEPSHESLPVREPSQTPDTRHQISTPERSQRTEGSRTPDAAPAPTGTPAGQAAAALNRAGLRITSHNPNLLAACAEGVSVELLLEVHALYPDKGAGYVIQAARGIHAERAQSLTNGETHAADHRGAAPRRESLSDRTKRLNAEHDARESDPGF